MSDNSSKGIKTLQPGESYIGFCVVRKKELRTTQKGEPYLFLELSDWSGRLNCKVWENARQHFSKIKTGQILKIKATVQTYKNTRELKILKYRLATKKDAVSAEQLLPKSDRDIPKLKKKFFRHLQSIKEPSLRTLLDRFFEDADFVQTYLYCPAGKLWHHNYLYGMLEHVLTLLDMSEMLVSHYPEVNRDLLKTAIILHDVGKIETYSLNGFIDKTDRGRLLGHVFLSYEMVLTQINEIEDFPEALKTELLHLICSHQREEQNEVYTAPMTLEAIVLAHLNTLDATTNAVVRIMKRDVLPTEKWSKFIPLLDRFIYIRQKTDQQQSQDNET